MHCSTKQPVVKADKLIAAFLQTLSFFQERRALYFKGTSGEDENYDQEEHYISSLFITCDS